MHRPRRFTAARAGFAALVVTAGALAGAAWWPTAGGAVQLQGSDGQPSYPANDFWLVTQNGAVYSYGVPFYGSPATAPSTSRS